MTEPTIRQLALMELLSRINPVLRQPRYRVTQPGDPEAQRQWKVILPLRYIGLRHAEREAV